MPDPSDFDFDAARRALDEVPAPDLWAEAERRAEAGEVVPLTAGGGTPGRRPMRWLAVAAVALLAAGTVGVLTRDDDAAVDVGPRDPGPAAVAPGVAVVGDQCMFAVSGEPVVVEPGPADPPLVGPSGLGGDQLVGHLALGTQMAEIHVPGYTVIDLVGERVDEVELERGTAAVWFGAGFVQVRWFPGDPDPCESFSVTVAGSTEDGNRHAAVDLAERILLPSDLDGPSLKGTEWQLERATVDGVPTEGRGATVRFRQNDLLVDDGCNDFYADFHQDWPSTLEVGEIQSTKLPCPNNPTSSAITTLLAADDILVTHDGDGLVLSAAGIVLELRSPTDGVGAGEWSEVLPGTTWRVVELLHGDEPVPLAGEGDLIFTFSADQIGWNDGCNSAGGDLAIDDEGYLTISNAGTTLMACGDEETTAVENAVHAVMAADTISVRRVGDRIELSGGEKDRIVLEAG